jgi:hypothetical protein
MIIVHNVIGMLDYYNHDVPITKPKKIKTDDNELSFKDILEKEKENHDKKRK